MWKVYKEDKQETKTKEKEMKYDYSLCKCLQEYKDKNKETRTVIEYKEPKIIIVDDDIYQEIENSSYSLRDNLQQTTSGNRRLEFNGIPIYKKSEVLELNKVNLKKIYEEA